VINSSIQNGGNKRTIIIRVYLTLITDDPPKRKIREERERSGQLSATGILRLMFSAIYSGIGPLTGVGGISDLNMTCHKCMIHLFLENLNSRLI
jgi:hypothetical protein